MVEVGWLLVVLGYLAFVRGRVVLVLFRVLEGFVFCRLLV